MLQHLYKFSDSHGGLLYAWFPAMHTRVDLLLRAVGAIRQELCRLEKMGNCYDAGSELACLNRTASVKPQPVSRELYDMLAFCIDCYTRTDGCFDVTVHSDCHTQESVHTVRLSPGGADPLLFTSRSDYQPFRFPERLCSGEDTATAPAVWGGQCAGQYGQ